MRACLSKLEIFAKRFAKALAHTPSKWQVTTRATNQKEEFYDSLIHESVKFSDDDSSINLMLKMKQFHLENQK